MANGLLTEEKSASIYRCDHDVNVGGRSDDPAWARHATDFDATVLKSNTGNTLYFF
jgi:hypothetical protein